MVFFSAIYKIMYDGKEWEMKEQLIERINILEGAGMIIPEVADFCLKAVDYILEAKPDADEEDFGMLITHLAMGTQRLIERKEENPVDENILAAIQLEPVFEEAERMAKVIIKMSGLIFSKTESDFLKIHLCNLLS